MNLILRPHHKNKTKTKTAWCGGTCNPNNRGTQTGGSQGLVASQPNLAYLVSSRPRRDPVSKEVDVA